VEEILAERGIDVSYETVRCWAEKFGGAIAANIRRTALVPVLSGISTKWSSASTADGCSCGAQSTRKVRFSTFSFRNAATSETPQQTRSAEIAAEIAQETGLSQLT
jgi:hypothetical protein